MRRGATLRACAAGGVVECSSERLRPSVQHLPPRAPGRAAGAPYTSALLLLLLVVIKAL